MESLFRLIYYVPAILIALSFHEMAHGLVSTILGDDVPRLQGRLSINPLRHLDPTGTVFMILTTLSGAGFGWAKPVMVNPNRYKINRKVGMLLVALAGPVMNIFLAIVGGALCHIIASGIIPFNMYFYTFFYYFMYINICLAAFNILPIPPLDGSKVLAIILPDKIAYKIYSAGNLFLIILVVFSFSGILGSIMNPILNGLLDFVATLTKPFGY